MDLLLRAWRVFEGIIYLSIPQSLHAPSFEERTLSGPLITSPWCTAEVNTEATSHGVFMVTRTTWMWRDDALLV